VHGTWERVTITKNGKPVAPLMAVEDLTSSDRDLGDLVRSRRDGGHRGAQVQALAEKLPESVAAAVGQFVNGPLLDHPHRVGERLRFELEGYHSARRGQYRVVDVIKISHRGDVHG